VYVPTGPIENIPAEKIQGLDFKRIGHISFNSNESTNYSARELKSVHVELCAYLLKLEIKKCFTNKSNNFKQAGLISLKCIPANQQPVKPLKDSSPKNSQEALFITEERKQELELKNNLQTVLQPKIEQTKAEEMNIDSITLKELKALEGKKLRAVELEDFDEAIRLKDMISKLKSQGKKLWELEKKKREAVRVEDYETAKLCKLKIEEIRSSILSSEAKPKVGPTMINEQKTAFMEEKEPEEIESKNLFQPFRENKKSDPPPELPEYVQSGRQYEQEGYEEEKSKFTESHDNKIVPALSNKMLNEQAQAIIDEKPPAKREQPEPLSKQTLVFAESYTAIFALQLLELLFSKHYYLREEGLDVISKEIKTKRYNKILTADPEKIMNAIIDIVNIMVQTKIITLASKALDLLLESMSEYKIDKKSTILSQATNERLLDDLLNRLGDGNSVLNNKIEDTLLGMVDRGSTTLSLLVERLVQNNEKTQKLVKHAIKRYNLMMRIIDKYTSEIKASLVKNTIDYGLVGLNNANKNIRMEGCKLLVKMYSLIGEKLREYLVDITPTQKKIIDDQLDKAYGKKVEVKTTVKSPGAAKKKVSNEKKLTRSNKK